MRARYLYLHINLCCILVAAATAGCIAQATNLLTVKLEFFCGVCDCVAVLVNLGVERTKSAVYTQRHVLMLDMLGSIISVALLAVVSLGGIVCAAWRENEQEYMARFVEHSGTMIPFSLFCVATSSVSLGAFYYLQEDMCPASVANDRLNLTSNALHALIDFVSGFGLLMTALWMHYTSRSWEGAKHRVVADALGSFAICACTIMSMAFILREAAKTWAILHSGERCRAPLLGKRRPPTPSRNEEPKGEAAEYGTVSVVA